MQDDLYFINKALELANKAIDEGIGGPFGAIIVYKGKIIGSSSNTVYRDFDPTAHAEVMAIRDACRNMKVHKLEKCTLYTSCEPCPMCFSAIYFAKIERVVYATTHKEAGDISGFYMDKLYTELSKGIAERNIKSQHLTEVNGALPFLKWNEQDQSKNRKKSLQ